MADSRTRAFTYCFSVAIAAVFLALQLGGIGHALIVATTASAIFFIARPIWFPKGYGKYRIRALALAVAASAALSVTAWHAFLADLTKIYIEANYPEAIKYHSWLSRPALSLLFLGVIIVVVLWTMRESAGMGERPGLSELPTDKRFMQRMINVCNSLSDDLRSIDIETNWSTKNFVPLDAEVEITKGGRAKKSVTDLLGAIRRSKDRLFLVIGDPGSGKSVAMRKLCQDLQEEVQSTKKLPIYLNLKNWQDAKDWAASPPTAEDLCEFVKSSITSRDIVISKFFEAHFDELYESGHLFFVLDSFDEIPALLGEEDGSDLVRHVSSIIYKFLKGARAPDSQGVLASREYRRPTREFDCKTVLRIQPFSEKKIRSSLASIDEPSIVRDLFSKHSELVPVARNPMIAALISDYVETHNQFPPHQAALYTSHIDNTLGHCRTLLKKLGLSKIEVVKGATAIARETARTQALSAPLDQLEMGLPDVPVGQIVEVLEFARLARLGPGPTRIFSFSHRRFAEYFLVQTILEGRIEIPLQEIPRNSQWRDTLVLYTELAEIPVAARIAKYCWETIEANHPESPRTVHSLRFLRDAFKGRPECLSEVRLPLGMFISRQIDSGSSILHTKLAVETVGILDTPRIDECVSAALRLSDSWISRTCVRACRNLPSLSGELEGKLMAYGGSHGIADMRLLIDLIFSFSLSEAFKRVRRYAVAHAAYLATSTAAILALVVLHPSLTTQLFLFSTSIYLSWTGFIALSSRDLLSGWLVKSVRFSDFIVLGLFLILVFEPLWFALGDWVSLPKGSFSRTAESITLPQWLQPLKLPFLNWGTALLLLLTLPLYKLVLRRPNRKHIKIKLSYFYFFGTCVLPVAAVWLVLFYWPFPDIVTLVIFGFFCAFTLGSLLVLAGSRAMRWFRARFVDMSSLDSREGIHAALLRANDNYSRDRILCYLEENVKDITGAWPDDRFLRVGSGISRLAALEERWLGLDR